MGLFVIGILVGAFGTLTIFGLMGLVRYGTYIQGYKDALFDQHKVDMAKVQQVINISQVEPEEDDYER